jgi:hypothetical protein
MSKQTINTGTTANDRSGDTLRSGGAKINSNFNELYTNLGNGSALQFAIDFTTTPTAGQSLQYNASTGKFVPGTAVSSQGGGYVNNAVVRYDGTTGTNIQNSSVTISDTGLLTANNFSGNGSSITALNATQLISGTVPVDRLGASGTRNSTTYLRGDNTWAPVSASRTVLSGVTDSLADSASANITIAGYKGYMLYKIQTNAAAWIRLYTDSASRSADVSRLEGSDPVPGSGVIAEVITTGAQTILISPGALGFNNETVPDSNIQVRVTNKSGATRTISVTLTVVQLEL